MPSRSRLPVTERRASSVATWLTAVVSTNAVMVSGLLVPAIVARSLPPSASRLSWLTAVNAFSWPTPTRFRLPAAAATPRPSRALTRAGGRCGRAVPREQAGGVDADEGDWRSRPHESRARQGGDIVVIHATGVGGGQEVGRPQRARRAGDDSHRQCPRLGSEAHRVRRGRPRIDDHRTRGDE